MELGKSFNLVENMDLLTRCTMCRKSQIAFEYCYGYREKYPTKHIFWVFASTAERFERAYADIVRRLNLPRWNDPKADTLQVVSDWFYDGDHDGWLLVLDNADDETVFFSTQISPRSENSNASQHKSPLYSYLPQTLKGSLLVTSRNRTAAFRLTNAAEVIIDISSMDEKDAKNLLTWKLPGDQSSEADVIDLLEELEYLPLAITQAAAYISLRRTRYTISKYSNHLRQNEAILLKDIGDLRRDHEVPNSVLKTWQISFDQIKKYHPPAANVLSLMSVIDRQGIPEFLLRDSGDDLEFEDAIALLHDFSLITSGTAPLHDFSMITPETDCPMFGIHRLVQLATRT